MRFYLNAPLVIGYVLMATTACLGMLQLAAARGDYAGLALFSTDQKRGQRLGLGLTVGALLAYVTFAPEILTPGPAGTEVAIMFSLCALLALIITLTGADRRIQGQKRRISLPTGGETMEVGDVRAILYHPSKEIASQDPTVVVLPDPTGFVFAPSTVIDALTEAGIAVLWVNSGSSDLSRQKLLGQLSTAIVHLTRHVKISGDHIGLIGLGLGGDAVWQVACNDPQIQAALAVSPVALTPENPNEPPPGLAWLHELSYRQIWRWRRQSVTFHRAVAALQTPAPETTLISDRLAVLHAGQALLAMRMSKTEATFLPITSRRHFTLLSEEQAIERLVTWFRDRLAHST